MRYRGDLDPAIGHEQADRSSEVAAHGLGYDRKAGTAERLPRRDDIPLAHLDRAGRGQAREHAGTTGDARRDPLRIGATCRHQLEQSRQGELRELCDIVRAATERRRGEEDVGQAADTGNGNSFEERGGTRASPRGGKIAAEHRPEIAAKPGRGLAGRVTKKDLLPYLAGGAKQGAAPAHAAAPPSMHAPNGADSHGPPAESWPGDLVEPMTPMRQRIAQHMTQSRRTSAHVTSFFEIDLTRVARIRAKQRATVEASTGYKLSYLPFIISAVVAGLKKFPIMNAAVSGNNIIYRKQYNIGIAVALDWGLIVPVIKKADDLSLSGLTRALNDLASRARAKKLDPREVQDGTFTITNPGIFGSLMGTPIISQPQVAILGVGAIEKRPKVITGSDGEDTIAIRTCAFFSISFDHRIIDGAVADEFLAFVKKSLESFPETGI